ncbi:helix-turn-helix transcriptional regulator [Allonocardiopsis opalescens]|uniref:Putative DNA-binding transcriptional regulator YafY n=1 Tax=Allonocardiopsis opalescens TaxID=1144618 RepID=A0A2T0Q4Y8_9ACTN|nr:YafY family protein [Allonocardiopsis opalescens]PRX98888.1 putative DNA-binding transcriptional regulator YafY [Allonocardiopsis opalescens]
MLDTSARLLRLLSLLQARRDWPGPELAERLGVSDRTVRRDVEKLRALGYPVHAVPGTAGYRLGPGAALPPLLLDDEEAVAVAVGLRTAAGGTVAGIEETSVRALAKLEQVLPERLRRRVNAVQSFTVPMAGGGPPVDPGTLSLLAAACRDRHLLRFDYTGRDGATAPRTAEPHRLVHSGRRWYLLAYDTDRADWRTFRADRIAPKTPTGPRFAPREPPDPDIAGYTSRAVSSEVYRYRGRFTVHAPAERVTERIGPAVGRVEPIDAGSCTLRTGSHSLDELALYVAAIGAPFQVHEPPELVRHVRTLADRLRRSVTEPSATISHPGDRRFPDDREAP